jgi:hypothetical protein
MSSRGSVVLLALFFLAVQILILPAHGWVTGDQGSKFLQTRAFAEQGPFNPAIDVRARDIDPEYHRQEPKLKNRRGRLVSEFLWLLPLVTAPFVRVLGMRGLYVVPALSVIAIFLAAAALGRRIGDGHGLRIAWIVLFVTPVVIYGFELWEHAPAVACVMVAAALLAPDEKLATGNWQLVAAGAAIAIGALFREEVIAALPALPLARAIAMPRHRLRTLITAGFWATIGAGIVFTAAVPVNQMIYGAPLPMHMTQDAWEVAIATPYMQIRRDVVVELLLPRSHVTVFLAAAIAGLAASLAQAWRVRARPDRRDDGTSRALVAVVHASAIAILTIAVALPLWRLAHGVWAYYAYKVTSAAHTWPFAIALLYWPWIATERQRIAARFLIASGLLVLVGTVLLVPAPGGSQWSPRFLLAVAPLLAIVAAAIALPPADVAARLPRGTAWMVRAILLASIVMQMSGLVWLQRAKARNARLTSWTANRTAPGEVLISNVFWFPEVTATLAPSRRMLFSWSATDVPAMAAMAVDHGFRRFGLVTSLPLTGYDAPLTLDVPGAPCRFVRGTPIGLDELGLALSRYSCEGP